LISAPEASSRRHRTQRRTRTLVENMWHELEVKIADVMRDFIQGLDLT
jgi:hypothetical protein